MLVIDDDPGLQNLICRFFGYNDYKTMSAADGKSARKVFREFQPDLVIIDVNLPDDSGFNLCQEIRQTGIFVLMLSSMTDVNYILEGFERGADDYITKPFNLQILKAKIDALFRRHISTAPPAAPPSKPLVVERLVIDFAKREVTLDDRLVALTALEFDILYFLASNPNRVWDRSALILAIWHREDYRGDDRKVDIHVGRIRKKIDDIDGKSIKTIWGRGYMFEVSNLDRVQLAN
ncbi:MAG: response regulator transcription factor [Xenococcaceae cyanobacterium]